MVTTPWAGGLARAWQGAVARPAYTLLSAISLAMIGRAALFAYRHFSSPAWFDIWRWVQDYQRWVEGRFTFHDLIKPHSDVHCIATTRLFLLLDSIFFDMNGRLPVIVSFWLLLAVGWMVSRLVARDGAPVLLPPLLWVALACSVCQMDNLIYAFQVQFAIACALACGAAWLLTAAAGEGSRRQAVSCGLAAGVLAVLADFTMASGALLAPALLLLLAMRRARWEVWAAFTPLCVLGVALYEYQLVTVRGMRLLGWRLNWDRVRYSGNFLASDLNYFSAGWTWIAGLALLAAFVALGILLLRGYTLRRAAVPSGDAALLALGVWVAACGPAGSLTLRMAFGPGAALVARYATMSLLFASVLLALALHAAARHGMGRAAQPWLALAAVLWLGLCGLPAYDGRASALQRVIAADAELFVNNVGLQGPVPLIFGGTIEDVRGAAVFLYDRGLNMFAPENGPPADLRAAAMEAMPAALPACRGWMDYAYALDNGAFLLRGWATDPSGKHNPAWIAALDTSTGGLVGMARPLARVPTLRALPGTTAEPRTFESGLRFAGGSTDRDAGRTVQVVALFPGRHVSMCQLPALGRIGPLRIVPMTALGPAAAIQINGVTADGFATDSANWRYDGPKNASLRIAVPAGAGLGQDVAVPFTTIDEGPGRRMVFHMADGTQFAIDLPSLWRRPAWRAVMLPAGVVARHHGLAELEVYAAGPGALTVGAPVAATVEADWARLF